MHDAILGTSVSIAVEARVLCALGAEHKSLKGQEDKWTLIREICSGHDLPERRD